MSTENPFEALGRNPIINAAANQKLDDTAASETRHMRRSACVRRGPAAGEAGAARPRAVLPRAVTSRSTVVAPGPAAVDASVPVTRDLRPGAAASLRPGGRAFRVKPSSQAECGLRVGLRRHWPGGHGDSQLGVGPVTSRLGDSGSCAWPRPTGPAADCGEPPR
jgi:hypothetical protein